MCFVFISISMPAFSEDTETRPAETATQEEPKKMTKEDILGRLNTIFEFRMDIREAFPVERLDENKFAYNGTPLENMDEESLLILVREVNQKISMRNLENIQRTQSQLRQIKQVENINKTQRMLRNLRNLNKKQ